MNSYQLTLLFRTCLFLLKILRGTYIAAADMDKLERSITEELEEIRYRR